MQQYLKSRLWTHLTSEFLGQIQVRYHYEEKDRAQLKLVAADMANCMKWQESTYLVWQESTPGQVVVVMTLGIGIDLLQERYAKSGRMMESYMVESIAGELLMLGYAQLEQFIREKMRYYVSAYHFFGSEEAYPLEAMKGILEQTRQSNVICNEAGCLTPKKSVVFLAELTKQENSACGQLCDTCAARADCDHAKNN